MIDALTTVKLLLLSFSPRYMHIRKFSFRFLSFYKQIHSHTYNIK